MTAAGDGRPPESHGDGSDKSLESGLIARICVKLHLGERKCFMLTTNKIL